VSQRDRIPNALEQITLDEIAKRRGFTLEQLQGKGRFARHVDARRVCFQYLNAQGWSTPEIGALFNRDHTTISYALAPEQKREKVKERYRSRWTMGARRAG
jgi:chromosomal replication initiation ATPase DnaA